MRLARPETQIWMQDAERDAIFRTRCSSDSRVADASTLRARSSFPIGCSFSSALEGAPGGGDVRRGYAFFLLRSVRPVLTGGRTVLVSVAGAERRSFLAAASRQRARLAALAACARTPSALCSASRAPSYGVPSRSMAHNTPASLRARATTAIFLPRVCTMWSAHFRNGSWQQRKRRIDHADWTSSARAWVLPCLVILPSLRFEGPPVVFSPGTSPKYAATQCAFLKRWA